MSTRTSRSAAAEKRSLKGLPSSKQPVKHPLITCRISVFWEGENKFFKGQITREVHDNKQSSSALFHVEYDDGESHDEDLKNDRFRWHGPRATSSLVPYRKDMRPAMLDLEAENVHGDKENHPGTVTLPKGGVPLLSEAVGWRIGFWWEGTREWVDGEVLSYRASDARHLVVFVDGEFEWMSLAVETIRWIGNTRERGNRLCPISFGLDKDTSPPKGREAVDWVVDVYDKGTNQMQRVEIAGFDSVTGKHKIVFLDTRKITWISLTASKIVWRFPPGLPTPAPDAGNPTGEVVEMQPAEVAQQSSAPHTVPGVPGHVQAKVKGARQKRKSAPAVGTPDANPREASNTTPPSAGKVSKKISCRAYSACTKAVATLKGSSLKTKSPSVPTVPMSRSATKPSAVVSAAQAAGAACKRASDTATTSAPSAKRICTTKDAATANVNVPAAGDARTELVEVPPEESVPHRRRRGGCTPCALQPLQHNGNASSHAPATAVASPTDSKVVQFTAPRELSGPGSISNKRPASIWPVPSLQNGMRHAAFVRLSLAPPQSMVKSPSVFKNSVQCLLAATERRQQFVRALMKHLGDTAATVIPSAPLATPPLRSAGPVPASQNAALMTIPTDPRRASKPQILSEANHSLPVPQAAVVVPAQQKAVRLPPRSCPEAVADVRQGQTATPPASVAGQAAAIAAAPAPALTPVPPATVQPTRAGQTPSVSQFTPKFAPLSSFQRKHAVIGAVPVTLPAVAPDSKTVQEMLKQRSSPDAATQSVTLSMSMVAKAVSAAVPSSMPQAVRSPPSDQTSSSCKIDDVRCASLAKLGGARQQQTARMSSAAWQVSQMQGAGPQKQGIGVNKYDIHSDSCHGSTRVHESSRTSINRTVSSNVRTANLRWGGPPLVAARASIGLKGGSAGAGSAGGRACG